MRPETKKAPALHSIMAIMAWMACTILHSPAIAGPVNFDSDWRFLRADAPGAEKPSFQDSTWRRLDLPHDWSIEDLPHEEGPPVPELQAVAGSWRFQKGDDPAWKEPGFDDSGWQNVTLPASWEKHSDHKVDNAYGWFRRRIEIPAECKGRDLELVLGYIDDVDEVWLNGRRIGGTGTFPPDYSTAWNVSRRYRVLASWVRGDGSDLLAVRVFDGNGDGGIYGVGVKSVRVGPFDTGRSEGGYSTGHVLGGQGWYRKRFSLSETGKLAFLRFDGVYMNADVWINGHQLGTHPYGYTSFEHELTPHLKPAGQENVLAVRVDNKGKNSRWYSGSGIYRHVWLDLRAPIHITSGGVFVTTPKITKGSAQVKVSSEVLNSSSNAADLMIRIRIFDGQGKMVQTSDGKLKVPASATRSVEKSLEVSSPKLWSLDSPDLYRADVEVAVKGEVVDKVSTRFGIRKVEVDARNGFRLNGVPLELKGGNVHHDNGPLGSAAIDRAEERRVQLLKANGYNAIRTSHNPPSPAFLDACDRLGMLVLDEAFDCWNVGKNGQDYNLSFKAWYERDIASMVRRDRNHPSVVIWSIGNEIPEQFSDSDTAKKLREAILDHDTTRPVSLAVCSDWGKVMKNWDKLSDAAFRHLDIGGYNYMPEKYESDHRRHPGRVMLGTESFPKSIFDYWSLVEKHPYVIGDFVWTAMDYFGESGVGHSRVDKEEDTFSMPWPWHNAWCGDIDVCGFKKAQSYYRDVVWGRSDLEMAVHKPLPRGATERVSNWGWPDEVRSWNWAGHEEKPMQVTVYSRHDAVRLELNGKTIGEKPVSAATKYTATFEVPYRPGEVKAVGLSKGREPASVSFRTASAPKAIRLTADRPVIQADRNDLCYVTVEVVDEKGMLVPYAEIPIRFRVAGVGELAAVGSSAPDDASSFRQPLRKTFQGRCLVILRPKGGAGKVALKAEGGALSPASLVIQTVGGTR